MAPGTYGKTWWRNGYACGCMIQSIEDIVEPRLRAAGYLGATQWVDVYQYAYSGGVEASAGTHDGGGALDHRKGSDGETKIWRECGVSDWQRGSPEDTAFDDHNHGIWQGCPHLSSGAESQIDQYKAGCNGLSGWGPDQSPHVSPITWQDAYDKYIGNLGGLLGMSDWKKLSRTTEQTFTGDGEWKTVRMDEDDALSILQAPKRAYSVVSGYTIDGGDPGDIVAFRFQAVDDYDGDTPTKIISGYPIKDTPLNAGATCDQIMWQNDLDKSDDPKATRKLRLFIKPPDGKTIRVTYVGTRALYDD
jgi:hypothetical protein